ncbi:unnamed protein product [Brassica oleracea]
MISFWFLMVITLLCLILLNYIFLRFIQFVLFTMVDFEVYILSLVLFVCRLWCLLTFGFRYPLRLLRSLVENLRLPDSVDLCMYKRDPV